MLIDELENINTLYYNNTSSFSIIATKTIELTNLFPRKSFKKFTQKDVEKYVKYLKQKGNKPATINSKLAYLSKCLHYYDNNNLKIPYQKIVITEKEVITEQQYKNLLLAFKDNTEMQAIIQILYNTGLRISEVLALQPKDIITDGTHYFLYITKSKNNKKNYIPTKNINNLLKNFKPFTLTYRQVIYQLKQYNITPHQFRHTFITRCYEQGLDSFTIMKLTNQHSLSVNKRYCHLSNISLIHKLELIK